MNTTSTLVAAASRAPAASQRPKGRVVVRAALGEYEPGTTVPLAGP
ncbi:hypothetical protein [Kitasatospora sp. NPDC093679]